MKLIGKNRTIQSADALSTRTNLAVYPGSFNPLHDGHRGIYELLVNKGYDVVFEISRTRYQKAPFTEAELKRITDQFHHFADILVSDAPLFSDKRDQLEHLDPYWIMGYDTAKRWIEENRSVDEAEKEKIAGMKVIFVGRLMEGVYYDPTALLDGTERYEAQVFHYRCDISSTQIRLQSEKPKPIKG